MLALAADAAVGEMARRCTLGRETAPCRAPTARGGGALPSSEPAHSAKGEATAWPEVTAAVAKLNDADDEVKTEGLNIVLQNYKKWRPAIRDGALKVTVDPVLPTR